MSAPILDRGATGELVALAPASKARARVRTTLASPTVTLAIDAIFHSYSQVFLAKHRGAGGVALFATLLHPAGAVGLASVMAACALATGLKLDEGAVRSGAIGANALLVGLALAHLGWPIEDLALAWPAAVAGAVLTTTALSSALRYHLALPALSLPFVVTTWAVHAAAGTTSYPAAADESWLVAALSSLGALFFTATPTAGAAIALALLLWSRVAFAHAVLGLGVASLVSPGGLDPVTGFNAALTAVALGGIFYIPGPASLGLAAAGAGLCTAITVATNGALDVPALAFPLNATVLLVLYALAQRSEQGPLRAVVVAGRTPEETLQLDHTHRRRFGTPDQLHLSLPFRGTWTCTQGNDGAHTHQGDWRHGLDFEVTDADGERHSGDGGQLTDWFTWRQPVLSMALGTVVKVVDGLPDNAIGQVDTTHNWGNVVVVQHGPECFSLLAHLASGSIRVVEGEVVGAGQVLGLAGNSGRSPVPHLHVQLQRTATVGDPTRAIQFASVVSNDQALHRSAVPSEGQRWRNPSGDESLQQLLSWPTGTRLRMTLLDGESLVQETVTSTIDLLGRRSLVASTGDRLWFDHGPRGLVLLDHCGDREGGLFALYCGIARVPFDRFTALSWTDSLDPRRISGGLLPWLADVLGAFMPADHQPVRFTAARLGSAVRIVAQSEARRPWQRETHAVSVLDPQQGSVVVDLTTGQTRRRVVLEAL